MAFPPQFLDEVRSRIGLADLIGRRVKLTRKGREFTGLCPFHNEKTPSFSVSEEKGFFHCFGCGAHGDIFGFIMRTENLEFPEAVQRLADEVGLVVPKTSPKEREFAAKKASLLQVMEQACRYFEENLRSPAGKESLNYFKERGLDNSTIAKFRLGFAPDNRGGLKAKLLSPSISEVQLIDCGLLIKPDDPARRDQTSYDRFRGRVTFPITDSRGKVIAFGARTLGHTQPKYINSPETPLFSKGSVLYGLAKAWSACREEKRVIVTEGYMDVIALDQAGIKASVAPLGTALTEQQISLLWRMSPEPILCFDGDEAGIRAAKRAAERALPLLKPGYSIRFVNLPAGEDPDTLIKGRGGDYLEELLNNARPLDNIIWDLETAKIDLDTPERLAGLESRLETHARSIADGKVQYQYRDLFRERLRTLKFQERQKKYRGRGGSKNIEKWAKDDNNMNRLQHGNIGTDPKGSIRNPFSIPLTAPEVLIQRREQAIIAALVNHWGLIDEFAETIGMLDFIDEKLDSLRKEILTFYTSEPENKIEHLHEYLKERGFEVLLQKLLTPQVYTHAGFARSESEVGMVRKGISEMIDGIFQERQRLELAEAEKSYALEPTEENWMVLQACLMSVHQNSRTNYDERLVEGKTTPDPHDSKGIK